MICKEAIRKIDLLILADILAKIAGVIGSCGIICAFLKKYIDKMTSKITEPILNRIDKMDNEQCKNYLMEFLNDVKNGVHKNEYQIARAYEVYEHYSNDLKGNSYIHKLWIECMEKERKK